MSAQEIITTAVKNQPKKRSCLRGCLITFLVLALPVWWFCFHTTPLRVSKETTYVLGPKTSDGKRIDYFRAMEEQYYPPEMKTDDNGYRMIVRALGVTIESEPLRIQVYEKLGLDPNEKPTLTFEPLYVAASRYDKEHPPAEGEKSLEEKFWAQTYWTFDDFPMFKDWLEENTAGIDLIAEAARKPAFFMPYYRENENTPSAISCLRPEEFHVVRDWARAMRARATYRFGIGDIDGAIDDIGAILHLARHAGKQGTLMCWIVGNAYEGMGYYFGLGFNPDFQPTREQIERLMREIDVLPPRQTFGEAVESERYFSLGAMQDVFWGYNPGICCWKPSMSHWKLDINIGLTRLNNVYDFISAKGFTDEFWEETQFMPTRNHLMSLFVRGRTNRITDYLIGSLAVSMQQANEVGQRTECSANLQHLTLALLLYEKDNGTLPEGDWREAIKPYLGKDADKYFQCPSHRLAQGETNYAMIGNVPNLSPSPNQILLVEVTQPQKLGEGDGRIPYEQAVFSRLALQDAETSLGSPHPGIINIGFRSGAVRSISITTKPEVMQSLLDGTATALP